MAKARSGFSGELKQMQGEVDSRVTTILELAKHSEKPPLATSNGIATARRSATLQTPNHQTANDNAEAEQAPRQPTLNVTTRLTAETNDRLTEAALRQRLKKVAPATRQEIMEQAVQEWLVRHGYDEREG